MVGFSHTLLLRLHFTQELLHSSSSTAYGPKQKGQGFDMLDRNSYSTSLLLSPLLTPKSASPRQRESLIPPCSSRSWRWLVREFPFLFVLFATHANQFSNPPTSWVPPRKRRKRLLTRLKSSSSFPPQRTSPAKYDLICFSLIAYTDSSEL